MEEDWGKMKLTEAGGQELERQKNSWQRKEHARLQIVCGLEKIARVKNKSATLMI